jgi:hypothetical protein
VRVADLRGFVVEKALSDGAIAAEFSLLRLVVHEVVPFLVPLSTDNILLLSDLIRRLHVYQSSNYSALLLGRHSGAECVTRLLEASTGRI